MDSGELRVEADSIRGQDPVGAAGLYAQASDLGDVQASSSLGYMYMVGEGVDVDMAKARLYLERAVDGGETKAMCNLGNIILEEDPLAALDLFERAGELGSTGGMRNAATMYRTGAGIPVDLPKAVEWLGRAAETDVDSMVVLAHILRTGEGVESDKPRAVELYRRAAELGDMYAQYDLAMMLDAGDGVPMDRKEAERWFREAAAQGDNDARLCIGGMLYERRDFQEAETFFMDAALDGDVKAMYNLALIYVEGSLGEPDMVKAKDWLESASEIGFAYAQTMLGSMLMDEGKVKEAAELFRKSADQNEPSAMYNLAALGLSGQIKMDDKEAIRLLMGSAEAGMPEAQELLMRMSSQGLI